MEKSYKELRVCQMCKGRFVVKKDENGRSRYYCDSCHEKYFSEVA